MKNKKVTYVLLVCVLFIWGYIAYRLLSENGNHVPKETIVQKQDLYNWKCDTSLLLNYECPFTRNQEKPKSELSEARKAKKGNKESVSFRSFGLIVRNGVNYFPISIDNNMYTLKQGDRVHGFLLKEMKYDTLYLEKQGNIYSVKLNIVNEK